jgi:hypothetical protein
MIKIRNRKKTSKERVVAELVTMCRTASRRPKKVKKGINQCDVTFELLYQMMESQNWKCIETNLPLLILDSRLTIDETTELGMNRLFLPSIDRIDNNKGYTIDNIRIVTQGYNNLKNIYNDSEVWEWINLIKSNK